VAGFPLGISVVDGALWSGMNRLACLRLASASRQALLAMR
jgi:hypothetical protein